MTDDDQPEDLEALRYRHILHRANDYRRRRWNVEEEIFASRWEQENERLPGLNSGRGLLELLLNDESHPWQDITQRDALVAASVIQWLGTNCGHAFLQEVERDLSRVEEVRRIFPRHT